MTWWNGRLAAFDVETTGVDPEADRIVTAAVVEVGGDLPVRAHEWLLNPGVPIAAEATDVHGITDEHAATGQDPQQAVAGISLLLSQLVRAGRPVVVFNARFDLTMLDREARRHGVVPLVERGPMVVIDPLVIDKHLDRYRRGSRKLQAICDAYGATLDDAHAAGADALAAARAAWVLGARGTVVRRVRNGREGVEKAELVREWSEVRGDLVRLHDAQRRWAHAQAVSLAEYFRGKGQHEDAAGVRSEWPLVPVPA